MNEQAQHVRYILRAEFDGETVMYDSGGVLSESDGFGPETFNMQYLLKHPERYSIKKEPRFIYTNVHKSLYDDVDEGGNCLLVSDWYCLKSRAIASADRFFESNGYKMLVIAHPIEIPEVTCS